jgi:uncharacterized protein YigA (DUF484 family)
MTADKNKLESASNEPLNDESVRDYLKDHSDFFERHPDMLDYLHISHSSGNAVSLVEKQVSVLRERNMEMRKRLNSLTANARDNDSLYDATRKLVLNLLTASNREALCQAFNQAMHGDFGVEFASLILFGNPSDGSEHCRIEHADTASIDIGALLKNRRPSCVVLRQEELGYLFPGSNSVGSAAIVPLHNGTDLGVIAVGNSDSGYYSSSMGTLFLTHIADVIVRLLPKLDSGAA